MANRNLEVIEENGSRAPEGVEEERIERLVALGRALPACTGARMLGIVLEAALGPECCGVRTSVCRPAREIGGLCVCNLQDRSSMGQSKVFSHMRKLKDAGLVLEEKRGNSSFYSLGREAVQGLLGETTEHLLAERPWPPVYDSSAVLCSEEEV